MCCSAQKQNKPKLKSQKFRFNSSLLKFPCTGMLSVSYLNCAKK